MQDEEVENTDDYFNFRNERNKQKQAEIKEKERILKNQEDNKYINSVNIVTPNLQKDNKVSFHPSMLQQPFNLKADKRLEEHKMNRRLNEEKKEDCDKIIEIDYKKIRTPI